MKKIVEGSRAIAETVALAQPEVCAMYPITPSTHIPENLAQMKADGEFNAEIILVEAEFSAISACIGASATGVRTFTATSSQGLALMHEVLFAAAGMHLPIPICVANRALSAPLNIWNDHQDSISERDSGWIQLYAENNQEATDNMLQAFKISEEALLPTMSCMDGFYLTHTYEPIDVPEDKENFLGDYNPSHAYLDPEKPITQGAWAAPKEYMELRKELSEACDSSMEIIKKVNKDFEKKYGRSYGDGLIEVVGDSKTVVVTMGTLASNIRILAEKGLCELVKIRSFRPFPKEEVKKALEGKEKVIVLEKNISLGTNHGALYFEVKNVAENVSNVIAGLGGVDVTLNHLEKMIKTPLKGGETKWLI